MMPGKKEPREKPEPSQLDLWDGNQELHWMEFRVAREYVRSLKLQDQAAWEELVNKGSLKDERIPANPDKAYKNHGWESWYDWLGVEDPGEIRDLPPDQLSENRPGHNLWSSVERSKWINFHEARRIVREYGFEYEEEWELFVDGKFPDRQALPENIPRNPDRVYRFVGWLDWKDWLVHPDKRIEYTNFYEAREFARSCRIPDKGAWRDFLQKEDGLVKEYDMVLPARPHLEYKGTGWLTWEDWLGTEIPYHDFKSTRNFVHSLKLGNRQQWNDFCRGRLAHKPRRAESIYAYPEIAFRDEGWKSWEDWLETRRAKKAKPPPSKSSEVIIECKCRGRIKDCPQCGGKGYYYVRIS